MHDLFWAQARRCPFCDDYHYAALDVGNGMVRLRCKQCGAERRLRCVQCGAERFAIVEKLDALARRYRRPVCACGWTHKKLNLKLVATR